MRRSVPGIALVAAGLNVQAGSSRKTVTPASIKLSSTAGNTISLTLGSATPAAAPATTPKGN